MTGLPPSTRRVYWGQMGREILYCHRCGKQLLSEDFTRGRALTLQNRCYCLKCLPEPQTAAAPKEPARAPLSGSTRKLPKVTDPIPSRRPSWMPVAIGTAAVAVVLVAWVLLGSKEPTPPPVTAPSKSETAALAAIKDAKEFSAKASDNIAREVELWQKAVWASESLPCAAEAKQGLARAGVRMRESWTKEEREIEPRLQELLKIEQFAAAKALLGEALKRHPDPAWTDPLKRRIDAVQAQAAALYPLIRQKAADAKTREAPEEVAALRKRIEGWGLAEYTKAFDEDLSKVPDPMKAGAAKGIVSVLVGKPVERTLAQVKADRLVYGPKQEVVAGETHVYLPYGPGDYYYESQGLHLSDPAPGKTGEFVSRDATSGVRLSYRLRFDQPISSFRLRCGWCEIAPAKDGVAGVEYSVDGKTWITAVEYRDKGSGALQVLGSLLEKFEATGLKTTSLYIRIYTRDRVTGGGTQTTGCWLRLWTAGDPNWGDAAHTFFMHQVQVWVKPAAKD